MPDIQRCPLELGCLHPMPHVPWLIWEGAGWNSVGAEDPWALLCLASPLLASHLMRSPLAWPVLLHNCVTLSKSQLFLFTLVNLFLSLETWGNLCFTGLLRRCMRPGGNLQCKRGLQWTEGTVSTQTEGSSSTLTCDPPLPQTYRLPLDREGLGTSSSM